jgi:hypothetical protein
MDEDNNPIIKNTGDINIDTTTYFQQETQNITQNGDYIYEQNENGAWHLELKPIDSTEQTDVNINISSTPIYPTITSPIESNGYYKFDGNTLISGTEQDYNLYVNTPPISNKVVFYSMNHGGNNYLFSTFSNTSSTISLPANSTTLLIFDRNTYYIFKVYKNTSSSSVSYSNISGNNYYYKILSSPSNNRIIFMDLSNTTIFELNLVDIKDNYESIIFPRLFKNYFDIKF